MDHTPEMKAHLELAAMPPAVYRSIYGEIKPNTLAAAIAAALNDTRH